MALLNWLFEREIQNKFIWMNRYYFTRGLMHTMGSFLYFLTWLYHIGTFIEQDSGSLPGRRIYFGSHGSATLAKFITKISQNDNSRKSRKATPYTVPIEGPGFESHHGVCSASDFRVLFSSFTGLGSADLCVAASIFEWGVGLETEFAIN